MTSTLSRVVLAMGLVAVVGGAPTFVGAQSGAESSESEATDSSGSDASGQGQKGTEQSGADQSDKQAKSDESTSSGDATQGGDQSEGGEDDADSQAKKDNQKAKGQKKDKDKAGETGPGGKKLRDDYPANDKAKQKKMDTKRIEGLQFDEGENPSDAYNLEIQELETKIDDLKEKVFQSKSRVVLLKETVLGGNLSGSRAVIVHTDELGGRFKLQRAMYSVDGNRVFNESKKTGNLPSKKKFKVYDDSLTAGQHNVSILLEYQGSGFGIFNYMQGYEFKITSSCQFTAKAGKLATLKVRSVNKAGALKKVEKQPGIQCELTHTDLSKANVGTSKKGEKKKNKKGGSSGAAGGDGGAPDAATTRAGGTESSSRASGQ